MAAPGPAAPDASGRARGRRASATLEEALTATAPRNARPAQRPPEDFRHPDPLAGDTIMDATARLLAPRPRVFQEERAPRNKGAESGRPSGRRKRGKGQSGHSAAPAPEKGAPQSARKDKKTGRDLSALEVLGGGRNKKKRRRGHSTPREVELRHDHVKDSTELSASLMKPYYLSDD